MRKRIVGPRRVRQGVQPDECWLDLEQIATVEVTSEEPSFPIESALVSDDGPGWRASHGGEQQIRIIFGQPISAHRMRLRFHETGRERTRESFVGPLNRPRSEAEIVRQQWNFSPTGSTTEIEHHVVDLDGVSVLELAIRPDLHRQDAVATLASWRLG